MKLRKSEECSVLGTKEIKYSKEGTVISLSNLDGRNWM